MNREPARPAREPVLMLERSCESGEQPRVVLRQATWLDDWIRLASWRRHTEQDARAWLDTQ